MICSLYATYYQIVVAVSFSKSRYSIIENEGILQPVIVLSSPSSFDTTVSVRNNDKTTKSE